MLYPYVFLHCPMLTKPCLGWKCPCPSLCRPQAFLGRASQRPGLCLFKEQGSECRKGAGCRQIDAPRQVPQATCHGACLRCRHAARLSPSMANSAVAREREQRLAQFLFLDGEKMRRCSIRPSVSAGRRKQRDNRAEPGRHKPARPKVVLPDQKQGPSRFRGHGPCTCLDG